MSDAENRRHVSPEKYKMTVDILRQHIAYDPVEGTFTWLKLTAGRKEKPGCVNNIGYHVIVVCGTSWLAHRLAWYLHTGAMPPDQVDHIDCDRLNNKMNNLRSATSAENTRNQKLSRANTSGIKGVAWHKGPNKWVAQIWVNRKNYCLGYFDDKEDARKAYEEGSKKYHGEFGRSARLEDV